ncbi:S41 family peptidase [Stenotrophomonas rhizophila]|jgi:C-terminal processing protease CtpA/Prc|uniref:S41 family peptidase n=1 Tax=Stenotrophomonas rhizophila TaxID=216778 RepID=UPI002A6A02FD|nr:S41 family peptidase [Stenotrophomonas rhizophila]MDY0956727.1 S41 family peptidase [Stenotrophomonas rhizophila]
MIAGRGWLLMVALATASGAAHAQDVPSAEAQARILDLLQQQSLYRDRVDWSKARAELAAARDPAQTRRLLDDVIQRSSGGHGRWISANQQRTQSQRAQATQTVMGAAPLQTDDARTGPTARLGWIKVGAYMDDQTQPQEVQYQARKQAAIALQARIQAQDDGNRCGWVVDLRGNTGGNMWPMLLGMGPLLGDAKGADPVGMFLLADKRQPWAYREGAVWLDGKAVVGSRNAQYTLRHPGAPVAVLFGPRTASSGEASVLAFRGRAASRSFGQPSAGYSTANTPQRLPDGSLLLLTGSVIADRNGVGDGNRLQPDVIVAEGQDATTAAQAWLLAQPACKLP